MQRNIYTAIACMWFAIPASAETMPYRNWVVVESARFYERPGGAVLGQFQWASELQVDVERLKTAPPGWIPTFKDRSKAESYLWFRREDLWNKTPKRVIACWPIKKISYQIGDYGVEIDFKPNGSGLVKEYLDKPGDPGLYKTHAYMSQNIVQFQTLDKSRRYLFTAGYKPEDRYLYPDGSKEYAEQILFDKNELRGCGAEPVVQK